MTCDVPSSRRSEGEGDPDEGEDGQFREWADGIGAPALEGVEERVTAVEGVRDERLPRIHGKLIALGFLKFELAGRTAGVRYQISRLGLQAIERLNGADDDSESFDLAQSA